MIKKKGTRTGVLCVYQSQEQGKNKINKKVKSQ